jgi:phage tail-like protein
LDWKSLYNNAFPAKQPFTKYEYPQQKQSGPPGASQYQGLVKPGPSGESSFPQLQGPGPWEGGQWPQLQGPAAGEGSSYPELPGTGPAEGSSYPSMRWVDHVGDWNFRIEIEGQAVGHFTRVEGLTMNVEVIEYQHSDDIVPRKRMGRIKVDNVRLVKGYVVTADLFEWCENAMKGDVSRKSVSVVLLADDHLTEMTRYNLFECWPVKWSGFKLDGKGQGALVEEIELAVEEIRRG